ncbi:MAG: hypothetical protein MR646_06275 [Agathobacter sp.]|nr:hypothetical protein [Agathobacter sp.]
MANQTQILNVSDEMKFDDNVQTKNVKEQEENMYSSSSDTTEELCSSSTNGTCGSRHMSTKGEFVEILVFTHFARIFKFNRTPGIGKKKEIFHEVKVSVGFELV